MKPVLVEIKVTPDKINTANAIREAALKKAELPDDQNISTRVVRRSIDARSKRPLYVLQVAIGDPESVEPQGSVFQPAPLGDKRVIIVGAGPAGYFAALTLLENGILPIVLERGKDVNARRKDLKKIYTEGLINPNSNYCFGEGGAGTYSDGKLYTRATKRGNVGRILDLFIANGAPSDIRIDAHPHLGSNVLPKIVSKMRDDITACGGEIRFDAHVDDFILDGNRMTGVRINGSETISADAVLLATGHSARDIFHALVARKIKVEAKPFALGVRIEHPQPIIDKIFYHQSPRHENLPAASYRIATQVEGRGVFSFCMCPGGYIVPASTAPGELVLNGMSLAARNAPFANAGLVAEIRLEDVGKGNDPLAALDFQASVERTMFAAGDGLTQKAPAQRVGDFVAGRISSKLPKTSYIPGIYSAPVHELLPFVVSESLRMALPELGRKFKGFDSNEAKVLAVESRTSSPVRIPRDRETFEHVKVKGFFPCGEGAGYAGGIISAAMDGEKCAQAIVNSLTGS
ncbi:NAD(P)/FAD-dependent oxidoreductase [Maridesulfovibrio ferrireducens]|uniref:NAD(P)/FAD-dependent oxidoreductase n=1 Tax=Maridesulfovibrio ferrireducens TaxID=246191 RepID=UPI001A346270|nr:FAD-dependent oxidoreductase [Maridesulfovibrio ferrireducens]MBI9111068.1 FAD-dependent oxidoreductase [Maridesulfovibrio ferrireducens]